MRHVQRFALDNIYCAPSQDKQYSFKMARTHRWSAPPRGTAAIYAVNKHLPTKNERYQVFTIGNMPAEVLNLLSQKQFWLRDSWIKVSDDMVERNYILKVYNADGVMFPRDKIFYSFVNEHSLIFALEVSDEMKREVAIESFVYLNIYSNAYFQTAEFASLPSPVGIDYKNTVVYNNLDKVQLQNYVANKRASGGEVFIYVNGYWVPEITLNIPDMSQVELVYDQSVVAREYFRVKGLRTFSSVLDQTSKYLVMRPKTQDYIQYQDDTEVYIHSDKPLVQRGVYFYKHKAESMRNVTDKDYSLHAQYVNNTCIKLGELVEMGMDNKQIVIYTRKSGRDMPLVYSSLKLHEFYKLPLGMQEDILNNTNYTLDNYRVERLESSEYFQIARASKMHYITPEVATKALGYAAVAHYYADTPQKVESNLVKVPELYQWGSMAFEHDSNGLYTGYYPTNGPVYQPASTDTAFVEFVKGMVQPNQGSLHPNVGSTTLADKDEEVWAVAAYFDGPVRQSAWEDINTRITVSGSTISWNEAEGKKVKLIHSHNPNIYEEDIDLFDGVLYFPITSMEDRGTGVQKFIADVPYLNISLYLNGNYLTEGIDYHMDFPYVSICSKKYINYALPKQKLHVRASGWTSDKNKINYLNVKGFVNNGALTRNNYYDLRDDRVYSVFVDGKMYDKGSVYFSESDNTVRLSHAMNGKPYTVRENFIPTKFLTGENMMFLHHSNARLNAKIAELFNIAYPEPDINEFNIINEAHYLYSPVVSKMVNDILTGVLPESVYSTPYNDTTILQLVDGRYKDLLKLDPIKHSYPATTVEIHPHLGNAAVELNLLQYRFITNVVRIITNNQPQRINLSGYLSISD